MPALLLQRAVEVTARRGVRDWMQLLERKHEVSIQLVLPEKTECGAPHGLAFD